MLRNKNLKQKIKKCIVVALMPCMLVLTQCTKDPEFVSTNDDFNSENYPADQEQLFSLLVPVYAQLRSGGLYGRNMAVKFQTCMAHEYDLAFGGDDDWNELVRNNLSNTNGYANDAWKDCYGGIKNANLFLDRLQFYKENHAGADEEDDLNHMEGEARFLRALYYFYLESFYGESYIRDGQGGDKMGVPITSLVEGLAGTQVPRSSVREVWDYIIADLKAAETLLDGHVWPGNEEARVDEWAAKGLLGKVYVFTEDWASAQSTLKDVIDNSGNELMSFEKYKDAFNANISNEYNEESLFEVNIDRDLEVPKGNTNLSTVYGLIIAPSHLGKDGTEENAGALGFGNEFVHDKNLFRFGFDLPLWTLVDNPDFDPNGKPSPSNPPKILDPDYRDQSLALRENKTVDPRLYVGALQPWIDSVTKDGEDIPVARYKEIPLSIRSQYYGWSIRKYATIDDHLNNFSRNDGANIYILRLADVYLLYAEASMELGDNTTALEYLNKVKRRAYDYPVDIPSLVDYLSLSGPTSAIDPVLKNDPLKYERWAELFGEGQWWFDVCRWRIGQQEADYYERTVAGGPIQWNDNKSYIMPIPAREVNTNTVIVQNPGY